ncbi:MAG: iron-sulfur cluster assembly scaffold protein [Candidatus Bathyarchaeia archaeon]
MLAETLSATSILTEMIKGKSLQDAWKISWKEVSDELGGLPSIKYHCGVLAVGALRRAIRAYYTDKPKPDWLPEELTREEKQALEEEKLMEVLFKRAQNSQLVNSRMKFHMPECKAHCND